MEGWESLYFQQVFKKPHREEIKELEVFKGEQPCPRARTAFPKKPAQPFSPYPAPPPPGWGRLSIPRVSHLPSPDPSPLPEPTHAPFPSSLLPSHPIPQGHRSAPALSSLSHALNQDWQSISHMVIYMFQWYCLKSSHPRLLPQSPKLCSLSLCLPCCFSCKVFITMFLNSIYMH